MIRRLLRASYWRRVLNVAPVLLIIGALVSGGDASHVLATLLQQRTDWLARQSEAMLPEQRGALDALAQVPRYTLDATLDLSAAEVSGRLVLEYTNMEDAPLGDLVLRLWPNASTIYGGGSLTVQEVTRQGEEVGWRVEDDPTILSITLDPPLPPGGMTTVEMAFRSQVPRDGEQGYRIYYTSDAVTSLAGWHPILAVRQDGAWNAPPVPAVGDANLADIALYEVHLRVPAGYQVIATGTALDREQGEEGVTWHLVSGPARGFTPIVSNRFQRQENIVDGVSVNLYTLPGSRATVSAEAALALAASVFQTYQDRFGPYPLAEMDVVHTLVSIGGYEYSGLVSIESRARQSGSYGYYRWLLAHELAHQWWFNLVGNDCVTEPWLDEALASYAVALYLEQQQGEAAAQAVLNEYERDAGGPSGSGAPLNSSALDFATWTPYRNTVYYRGALFLAELREEMGDMAFFAFLQRYGESHRFGQATTSEFLSLAREMSSNNLDSLIARWSGGATADGAGRPSALSQAGAW